MTSEQYIKQTVIKEVLASGNIIDLVIENLCVIGSFPIDIWITEKSIQIT